VLALIYIDRLIQQSNFLLTELNVHRVVITAVLLAAKFFDDAYYNNAYYAKVGGVLVSEMNGLEVDFLFRINFSLHVASDVFGKYRSELMVHSSIMVNNNNSRMTMQQQQPGFEALTTQLYAPQTIPMQSAVTVDTRRRQGNIHHQVTPSPPSCDYQQQHIPPDYAIVNNNPYYHDVLHHSVSVPIMQQHQQYQHQQQQLGFHPLDHHHSMQQQVPLDMRNHYLAAAELKMTPSFSFPQHFADNPYYVPPNATTTTGGGHHSNHHHLHGLNYDATPQVDATGGGNLWNFTVLGAGM
jgi:hypothetical protein